MELNYGYSSIKLNDLKKYETQINEIVNKFNNKECLGNDYIGWYDYPFNIKDDEHKKYIQDVVLKYLEPMIPSTSIVEYKFNTKV